MMAWKLARGAPEVRAIALVEGTDMTPTCHQSHPMPVIEFHAADDDHVPFKGGIGIGPSHATTSLVPATQAKWVAIDRFDPAAKRVLTIPGGPLRPSCCAAR